MKINHIGIEVSDIYKMELFYRKIFGFNLKYRYISKNTSGLKTVFLSKESIQLELLQRPQGSNLSKNNFHIAFQVNNVFVEYKQFIALGLKDIKPPRETGDGYLEFELKDPEGNIIEISKKICSYNKKKIEAMIFGLDGTLIDSENNYFEADKKLFKTFGVEITQEIKKKYVGLSTSETMIDLKRRYNIQESVENLINKLNENYLEIAGEKTKVFPEMKKFLGLVKNENLKVAVASGSSEKIIHSVLADVDLIDSFDVIVSSDIVKNGKPAPDIFLETSKKLNIPPEHCLVIEDSQYGVEAAKRAFMYCMAVPYLTEPLSDNFLMADLVFKNGISDFSAGKAFKWVKSF